MSFIDKILSEISIIFVDSFSVGFEFVKIKKFHFLFKKNKDIREKKITFNLTIT